MSGLRSEVEAASKRDVTSSDTETVALPAQPRYAAAFAQEETLAGARGSEWHRWDPHLHEASFEFLLEREPASSILSQFALPVIERYFPEYPRVIAQMV
jgi:hypothetical protein